MFASFFGAFMVAAAYGYFHYKFSTFKFLDFKELRLYSETDLFVPDKERYALVLYSSKKSDLQDLIRKINTEEFFVIAIDFSQNLRENGENYVSVTGGFDTLLTIINRFYLQHIPSILIIKKEKKLLYKQDSSIEML